MDRMLKVDVHILFYFFVLLRLVFRRIATST